ncbi:MAG TPA: hypothetical protein VNH18_20515 [Bryobacteraceae bacterium]|nr:hypothetical protein [Bryobacteraceae bacterium]
MKNTLRTLLAFSILAVSGAAVPAWAADGEPMHVTVPFSFRAGRTILPAGDYTVSNDDSGIVMIKGSGGSAILLAISNTDAEARKSGVSFERAANGYCLKSVHGWGKGTSAVVAGPETADLK